MPWFEFEMGVALERPLDAWATSFTLYVGQKASSPPPPLTRVVKGVRGLIGDVRKRSNKVI